MAAEAAVRVDDAKRDGNIELNADAGIDTELIDALLRQKFVNLKQEATQATDSLIRFATKIVNHRDMYDQARKEYNEHWAKMPHHECIKKLMSLSDHEETSIVALIMLGICTRRQFANKRLTQAYADQVGYGGDPSVESVDFSFVYLDDK